MKPEIKKFEKASQALQAARKLISDKKRWVRDYLAVRKDEWMGRVACSTKSKNAEAFCALGAVKRVNGPAERAATAYLRQAALRYLQVNGTSDDEKPVNKHIFKVNDNKRYGHKHVLKVFTNAIRRAKKDGN
jgi:hypothetical protein